MASYDLPYEVDFFPVGDGERSGDAIIVRFGDLGGSRSDQRIVVIDGGFTNDGEAIVKHLLDVVDTDHVDLVVSTHPDQDHITGLCTVLEDLKVSQLWMHLPWEHTEDIAELFRDGRVTDNSVSTKLRNELNGARILAEAALERGVPIVEPFIGTEAFGGLLRVLGPKEDFYESLLPEFRCTPTPTKKGVLAKAAGEALSWVAETLHIETLTDDGETSAENSTSVILLFDLGQRLLLTGDAGIEALELAAGELEALGLGGELDFIQVPHHGSRHNVGPSVLDRLVGPRLRTEAQRATAFVSSAPAGEPRHPARMVTNAFRRRGAPVYATQGRQIRHHHRGPARLGWVALSPLPLYPEVDE